MSYLRTTLMLIAASCVNASNILAQASTASAASAPDSTIDSGWERDHCLAGLTYGAPLKLAVSVAQGIRKDLASGQDVCVFIAPKLGLGGARLAIGAMRTIGTWGGAVGASAGVIRTFGAPSWADRQSSYVGASIHVLPQLLLGFELGWYHRLNGNTGVGRENIFAWSLGIGI